MPLTVGLLLALSFAVSLLALAGLIWAISNHQLKVEQEDAYTIFAEGEAGTPDVDTPKHAPEIDRNQYDVRRAGLDVVSRPAVRRFSPSAGHAPYISILSLMAGFR